MGSVAHAGCTGHPLTPARSRGGAATYIWEQFAAKPSSRAVSSITNKKRQYKIGSSVAKRSGAELDHHVLFRGSREFAWARAMGQTRFVVDLAFLRAGLPAHLHQPWPLSPISPRAVNPWPVAPPWPSTARSGELPAWWPGFPFGFLGAGGRLPKARRGRFFSTTRRVTQMCPPVATFTSSMATVRLSPGTCVRAGCATYSRSCFNRPAHNYV